ncbi:MAG: DUF4097 family beta strand repeat protein [Acidobacteria bacterium]|nr:DUF4097 family beta strand repeat protein [Acidobacteriota bacterium]
MKTKLFLLLTIVAVAASPLGTDAQERRRNRSSSTSSNGDRPVEDCNDVRVTFDRRPAITEETEMTIPASQVSTLSARTSNSGIYVIGWDRNEYRVQTCKAVPDDSVNMLREITTTHSNGRISVSGPSNREWMAHLIIHVPRISQLDFQTANGPIHLRDLAGTIRVSASNGPLHLDNVGGSVEATTANGPIHIERGSGDQRLTATNGPIHVALSGNRWDGPGLEVSTKNGPLTLAIPDSYGSGIRIETSDHSPIRCTAPACNQAVRTLSSPSFIRLGSGDPVVRLSTVNGPLSIQPAKN